MMAHACNPSVCRELADSLGYLKLYLQKNPKPKAEWESSGLGDWFVIKLWGVRGIGDDPVASEDAS